LSHRPKRLSTGRRRLFSRIAAARNPAPIAIAPYTR
jgi:hypothetical protein